MRVIVQRVSRASLTVGDELVSKIGKGVVCLCGLTDDDTEADLPWMASRILNLQLWPDTQERPWKESVRSSGLEVLLVSQFTLYAEVNKGKKPDFHRAMGPTEARALYAKFVDLMRQEYSQEKVFDGRFGAMMQVELVNDGPVTIQLETPSKRLSPPTPPPPPPQQLVKEMVDPEIALKRLEKKLAKVVALRQRVEKGEVKELTDEQRTKIASEEAIRAEVTAIKEKITLK